MKTVLFTIIYLVLWYIVSVTLPLGCYLILGFHGNEWSVVRGGALVGTALLAGSILWFVIDKWDNIFGE
jgi:hypothetical protein